MFHRPKVLFVSEQNCWTKLIIIKFAQKGLFELKRNTADHQRVLLLATSIMSIGIGEFCGIGNSIQADVEEQMCFRLQMFHQQIANPPNFNSYNESDSG